MAKLTLEGFTDPFLQAGGTYDFALRPAAVPELAAATEHGTNCIIVAHHVAQLLGKQLPANLLLTELFYDRTHTIEAAHADGGLQQGDFVFLGSDIGLDEFKPENDASGYQRNWHENPLNHLVVATGYQETSGDELVLHAAPGVNTEITTLGSLHSAHEKYRQVHAIRRVLLPPELKSAA